MKTIVPINYDCFIDSQLYPKKGENEELLKNDDGLYLHYESVSKVYFYFPIYDSNNGSLTSNIKVHLTESDILKLAEEIKNKKNKEHCLDYVSNNFYF
jgi:hypothetical protein